MNRYTLIGLFCTICAGVVLLLYFRDDSVPLIDPWITGGDFYTTHSVTVQIRHTKTGQIASNFRASFPDASISVDTIQKLWISQFSNWIPKCDYCDTSTIDIVDSILSSYREDSGEYIQVFMEFRKDDFSSKIAQQTYIEQFRSDSIWDGKAIATEKECCRLRYIQLRIPREHSKI